MKVFLSSKSVTLNTFSTFPFAEIGRLNYFLLLIAGMIQYAYLAEAILIGYVIPVSQCDIAMSANDKGILGGAMFVGAICSSHLWGFLADTRGRRCIIIPTLFMSFALNVCASLAGSVNALAVFRLLTGFL